MTLIAGAYCLDARGAVPTGLKESFKQHLCRPNHGLGTVDEFDSDGFFVVKWDSGAFNEPAWQTSPGESVAALVGDPLCDVNLQRPSRQTQLSRLVGPNGNIQASLLSQCRGTFTAISYGAASHTLCLATDMIGLRPVYYLVQNGIFLFASTLRVFEAMPCITKKLSTVGMMELCAFGFPLAERTPYDGISVLRECEVLTAADGKFSLAQYYDWTTSSTPQAAQASAAADIFQVFQDAVRIRLGADQSVYAFLSGGMDSRAIVSSLAMANRKIHALNFSPNGSQDKDYAQKFAEVVGSQCNLHCADREENPNFSMLAFEAKMKLEQTIRMEVDRPKFIWSGDGGSVGLGHVYMDDAMLDLLDRGNIEDAVSYFLKFNRIAIPMNILNNNARISLKPLLISNVLAELNRYARADLGRRFYLFLLFNDQRRHLSKHFETIDQHGLEFLVPFFDSQFLKIIADTPSRWGVLHRLYAKWFNLLPSYSRSTPWQTYPGHVHCPIAGDNTLSYQWAPKDKQVDSVSARISVAGCLLGHAFDAFKPAIFSRTRILMASVAHGLGIRDCEYIASSLNFYSSRRKLLTQSSVK